MSEREYRNREIYQGNANPFLGNPAKPKSEYLDKLVEMDDEALLEECKDKIWLSAYANNNPRSDYHWQCDACADECEYRNKGYIYDQAHKYHANG